MLHLNGISDDFITKFDYLTRKELLVFVYYVLEYNGSELLYSALVKNKHGQSQAGGENILDEFEKILLVYQSNDPYLV